MPGEVVGVLVCGTSRPARAAVQDPRRRPAGRWPARARRRSSPRPARCRSSRRRCAARRRGRPRRSSAALSSSLTPPRNSQAADTSGAIRDARRVLVTVAGDQHPHAREAPPATCGSARDSTGRPLRGSSIRPRNAIVGACGVPCHCARRRRGGEPVDEDAVGDDDRVAAEVGGDGAPGVLGDGDPAVDLLQARAQQRVGGLHGPRAQVGGVEGGDDRPLRRPQRQQRRRSASSGSCRCRTSNRPRSIQRPTRAAVSGPKVSRATEPL